MKNRRLHSAFRRGMACLLALLMLIGCAVAEPAVVPEAAPTIEGRTFPYLCAISTDKDPVESEMTLYFVDGGDIPYVALTEYMAFLSGLLKDMEVGEITYTVEHTEPTGFLVERPDSGCTLYVSTDTDSLTFSDFNAFTKAPGVTALVTLMDLPDPKPLDIEALFSMDEDAMTELLMAMGGSEDASDADDATETGDDTTEAEDAPTESDAQTTEDILAQFGLGDAQPPQQNLFSVFRPSINRSGGPVTVNLSDYFISLYERDGECYLPMQTLNDLFLSPCYMHYVFNGGKVIGACYGSKLLDKVYEAEPCEMSYEMAQFNYFETLFMLNSFYGLKAEHSIDNFADFLTLNASLTDQMLDTDPKKFDRAIRLLTSLYLDDLHSGYIQSSWRSGQDDIAGLLGSLTDMGTSAIRMLRADTPFTNARKAVYREWVPGYEEVDDTAFITFDSFTSELDEEADYYQYAMDLPKDTIELIIYANHELCREDSPITNVVVDLSNNGGGSADAAIFVISWMLGGANIALRDTFTGAETIITYQADVDLDHKFGGVNDSLAARGYNVYCMISPKSFSCGNLVPAACKGANRVTLIGQASSGGTCVVLPCTSASGTLYQISGSKQLSVVRNGSFYNIDQGVEPDVLLTKPESFYDRPRLVEYLHGLM